MTWIKWITHINHANLFLFLYIEKHAASDIVSVVSKEIFNKEKKGKRILTIK